MLIAQKAHQALVELDSYELDLAVVEQGLLGALGADRVAHEQAVDRIRSLNRLGLTVAQRLARGQPVYPGLSRGAVRRALEALRDAGVIESRGRADWRFTNPLLRRYVAELQPYSV
jgi:DNA-binding transcriptional ArsR family regulator